jgi:hypothetical protein
VVAPHARELAAVLACGPQAVLSHRSAGWLWQLLPEPGDTRVEVSLPQGDRGRRPGIRVHRVSLQHDDITTRENIPVTSTDLRITGRSASSKATADRDARLAAHGISVIRVTWRQVTKEPEVFLVRLAQTLTRAALHRSLLSPAD